MTPRAEVLAFAEAMEERLRADGPDCTDTWHAPHCRKYDPSRPTPDKETP